MPELCRHWQATLPARGSAMSVGQTLKEGTSPKYKHMRQIPVLAICGRCAAFSQTVTESNGNPCNTCYGSRRHPCPMGEMINGTYERDTTGTRWV